MIDRDKAVRQLFIGKIAEIIGYEKTIELLRQANNEVDNLKKKV